MTISITDRQAREIGRIAARYGRCSGRKKKGGNVVVVIHGDTRADWNKPGIVELAPDGRILSGRRPFAHAR